MNINNWLTDDKANYCRLLVNMKKVLVYANITRGCNFTTLWETASRTPSSLFACAGKSPCYGRQGGTPIPNFRDGMQGPSFPPCPLGTEKKFRLFLIFQRDGNPQRTVWLVSSNISWAGPQRLGALLGHVHCKQRSKVQTWWASARLGCCVTTCSLTSGGFPGRWLGQQVACSLLSIGHGWEVPGSGAQCFLSFALPGLCLLSCLAPPATPCFRPPRDATLIGLCEKQELQQREH